MLNVYKTLKLFNFKNLKGTLNCKVRKKINNDNICFYHEFVHNFCDQTIQSYTLNYIERWFCLTVENKKHLDLSFSVFKGLCLSCNLKITSELEVLNAIDDWIKYDPEERSKLAFQLIKTIRLPLLSAAALKNLLNSVSFWTHYTFNNTSYISNMQTFSGNNVYNIKIDHYYKFFEIYYSIPCYNQDVSA